MDSHEFVPAPPKKKVRKVKRIFRPSREVGNIVDKPDLDSMTFVQQLVAMRLAGSKHAKSTQIFRDDISRLARRHKESTMGISGKYLIHALDAGDIEECLNEVFGTDPSESSVYIDEELVSIALEESFEKLSNASRAGAKIIFASSRPASTLPLMIELARLAENAGAQILDSFDTTSSFIADGRKGRKIMWCSHVGVLTDGMSLLGTNDANAADDLMFHLPRPDLVVADHVFAGAALTNGYPTIAFAGLDSLAVAVASVPERQCLVVPLNLDQPCNRYDIIANNAKQYFSE